MNLDERGRAQMLGLAASARLGQREINRLLEAANGEVEPVARGALHFAGKVGLARGARERLANLDILSAGRAINELAERHGLTVLLNGDDGWPLSLDVLDNPPGVLFLRGTCPRGERPSVALVGSRKCSHYGRRVARNLASALAARGVVIVSGLARGVDRSSHEGALESEGVTWAVLGSGVSNIYPPESVQLADQIAQEGGCVLSEFSPEMGPRPHFFPRRNRIIAALAEVTIVVEAASRSGALITARWAADMGKEVGVIPGPVDSKQSEGALALIRDGAAMVRGADDICELLGVLLNDEGDDEPVLSAATPIESTGPRTALECRIVGALDHEPSPLDLVMIEAQGSAGEVLTALMSLENRGVVVQGPAMMFRVKG